jgi:hypothetical protein
MARATISASRGGIMLRAIALLIAGAALGAQDQPLAPAPAPEGQVRTLIAGVDGLADDWGTVLITDQASLEQRVREAGGERSEVPRVDFDSEVVLFFNQGAAYAKSPPRCAGTIETAGSFTVLVAETVCQVAGDAKPVTRDVYLFVALPRRSDKPYSICFDRRRLLSSPSQWQEIDRFALGSDGKWRSLQVGLP